MSVHSDIFIPLIYIIAAIPYALLGLYAWRRRPAVAVTPFAWAMLGMSIWTFTYGLEIFFPQTPVKIFFVQIEYIGIVSAPVFMLFFAFDYTGNRHLLTERVRMLIWTIPAIVLLAVWTNETHRLMWDMETVINTHGLTLLLVRYQLLFWIHTLTSYGMMAVAFVLLVTELVQRPGIYRNQITFVVLSVASPVIGSIIFVLGLGPIPNLDLAPLFFLPTALGLFWAILKYRLLEVLPTEHLTVMKNMKDGVVVLNAQHRILYINPTAETLLGINEEKGIGQPLSQLAEKVHQKLTPFLAGGEHTAEVPFEIGSQTKIFEVSVAPVSSLKSQPNPGASDIMISLHDVTQRKEAEDVLNRRETIMSAISNAAEQFLKDSSWERNIPEVLAKLGRAADVSRVYVVMNYKHQDDVIYSSMCYEWVAPGIPSQINNPNFQHVSLTKVGFDRWKDLLSEGNRVCGLVKNFPTAERKFIVPLGSLSLAAIPIFVGIKWWGFIVFDECREERIWTETELEAFHIASNIFGAAESRALAEQQMLRRQRSSNLLHGIVKVSLEAENIDDMAQIVVNRLGELIAADGCFLTMWDDAAKVTIPIAAYGMSNEVYAAIKPAPGDRTFTESVLQQGQTLIVEDVEKTNYADPNVTQNFPSKSALVLPLIGNKKKLGAVILAFNKYHNFQKEEIAISEQAAALIALAIEKFQAVEAAKRRADTSEILRKATVAIAEKLEMDQAVSHIFEQLNQVVPYDSASVQLLEGDELLIVGGHGWDNAEQILGLRFPINGDNPNHMVMETGKPYYLPEARNAYKKFSEPPHDHIRSWLGVPLIVQDKIIGLLAIDSAQPNHFKEEDINTAMEFGNQVAIALENARIFRETQTQAITDALTGVYNRRGLFELGEYEFERARRINRPFSIMMFDIDHFKQVNDEHGHSVGDQVLHYLARRCQQNSRTTDLITRYGGEEFVLLLPETNLDAAYMIAERLRQSIMNMPFITDAGSMHITVSVGVSEANNTDTLTSLIDKADVALYKAKHNGRNCVVVSGKIF